MMPKKTTVRKNTQQIFTIVNLINETLNSGRSEWSYSWTLDTNGNPAAATLDTVLNQRNIGITFLEETAINTYYTLTCTANIPSNTLQPVNEYVIQVRVV